MARTLLLTTGTSIANGTAALASYQRRASDWGEDTSELRQQIRDRLKTFDLSARAGRVSASAELNILERLPAQADDRVLLFATDTADGRACAEELARVAQEALAIDQIRVLRVQGLQVRDADTLRRTGLTNLLRLLIDHLADDQLRYQGGCVLCPNGGFKGVVPFMSVLGMIFRAPVVYVFEFSETLINLPPIPITFATDLFDRALPALAWAKDVGVFQVGDFYRRIPDISPEETSWFDSFLEISSDSADGRLAALSPLTSVLAERELSAGGLRISPRAKRDLDNLSQSDRSEVVHHLSKLSSALWRSQHKDMKPNSDLEFYPRGHNPWRFAGFSSDSSFHLCWFDRHDTYLRLIRQSDRQRAAFPIDSFTDYTESR
jgi:putative CRISPR-associated protein (TIGR02619 family)